MYAKRHNWRPIAILAAAVGLLIGAAALARAAVDPAAVPPPAAGWSLAEVMALIALILAGAGTLIDAARAVLHFMAPRTATTLDDRAADALDRVHDRLAAIESKVASTGPLTAVRSPQAGRASSGVLHAIVVVGLCGAAGVAVGMAILSTPGCSSQKVQAIEHAIWDCTAPQRAEAVAAVTPAVVSVIRAAGSADGKAIDLSTVKSAISKANVLSEAGILLSCAAASAIAILEAPAPAPPPGAAAAAPFVLDPAAVRATWAAIKRDQLGGADFRVTGGAVL